MMRARSWLVALLLVGCGSGTAEVGDDAGPGGFVITAHLKPTARDQALPATLTFHGFLDPRGDHPTMIASRAGTVGTAYLGRVGTSWKLLRVFTLGEGANSCSGLSDYHFNDMTIDRQGVGIHGVFAGSVQATSGDVSFAIEFTGTFEGAPDTDVPALVVSRDPIHPAETLTVTFDEALPAETKVRLVAPDGSSRPLWPAEQSGPSATFRMPAALGTTGGQLVVEPRLVDLAGNAATTSSATITTTPIPLVPEDGFEGTVGPYVMGAVWVDGATYPAISGARSLYLPTVSGGQGPMTAGPGRATMRLAVKPGARVVRASVRALLLDQRSTTVVPPLRAYAPDGTATALDSFVAAGPITRIDEQHAWMGAVQTLELPLPAGVKDEVLLDIDHRFEICGPPRFLDGALIDDVRVE